MRMTLLTCARCKKEKPISDFRPVKIDRHSRRGYFSWCRPCCSKAQMGYIAKKDPAVVREAKRATHYRTTYGITLGEYETLSALRSGTCWICGRPGIKRGLNIDHDHRTGLVRGLLCHKCNRGLRWFRDNPADLRSAAEYLETCDQLMVTALSKDVPRTSSTRKETQ